MVYTQEQLFQNEEKILAPYAIKSAKSRGRKFEEPEDPYRTPFQRDRDRIIHCKAFRRLSGKTQVFVASYGDHYRTRLTHSIEVAQVARDIARALGLNEDLCEAVALAHDLGHTPFGHAGEEAMNEVMKKFGDRFEHNEQSRRVVEHLERRSTDFPGLNLTFETLEGLMKHRKVHDDGTTPVIHSVEAQVVDIADAIAYHHHDLDDGLRAGVFDEAELEQEVELWRIAIEDLSLPTLGKDLFRKIAINRLVSLLINDVIESTNDVLKKRKMKMPLTKPEVIVGFSSRMQGRAEELAEFLGKRFYLHQQVSTQALHGQKVIKTLFALYSQKEELLPEIVRQRFDREKRHIVIKDYIAGMTDRFALEAVVKEG